MAGRQLGGGDVGGIILDFAKTFVQMRSQQRRMELAEQRFNLERDRTFKSIAMREQLFTIREQALAAKTERDQAKLELDQQRLQQQQAEAQEKVRTGRVKDVQTAISTNLSFITRLSNVSTPINETTLFSVPGARDPKDQEQLNRLISQTQSLIERKNKLTGVGELLETPIEDIEQIREPAAQGPQDQGGDVRSEAKKRKQQTLEQQATNAATNLQAIQKQLRDPNFSGDRVSLMAEQARLNEVLNSAATELRKTAN